MPTGKPRGRPTPLAPQIVEELRLAYVGTKPEVAANLSRLSARAGVARWVLTSAAQRRGWGCFAGSRPWTAPEIERLKEKLDLGAPITRIARDLGRSVVSAQAKAAEVKLLARVAGGYSIADLVECFGVRQGRVESWARRGLLGKPEPVEDGSGNRKFASSAVERFIKRYAREYDLSRVHQAWFKAVVFGSLGEMKGKV